jgi:hypothetical protein
MPNTPSTKGLDSPQHSKVARNGSISVFQLNDSHHQDLIQKGVCVVHDLIAPKLCNAAIRCLKEASDPQDIIENRPAVQLCVDRINLCVEEIFSSHYPFVGPLFVASLDRAPGNEDWGQSLTPHIDDAYPTIMPNGHSLQVLLYLSAVDEKEGAFVVYPQSYHDNRRWALASSGFLKFHALEELGVDKALELPASQGSAIFFHTMLHHSASANQHKTRTRHALLLNYHPLKRIVPPLHSMKTRSTLDRMYSTQDFLEHHKRTNSIAVSTTGRFHAKSQILTHASFRQRGLHYLLFVDKAQPHMIKTASSHNLENWRQATEPLFVGSSPIIKLHLHWHRHALLAITTQDHLQKGVHLKRIDFAAHKGTKVRAFSLKDFLVLPHAMLAATFHYRTFQKSTEHSAVVFYVKRQSSHLYYLQADTFAEALQSSSNKSLEAPAPIEDFIVSPILGDSHFAALVQTDTAQWAYPLNLAQKAQAGEVASSLQYNLTPTKLIIAPQKKVQELKLYDRAGLFWLLSSIDKQDPNDISWSSIDWSEDPLKLNSLSTPKLMRQALMKVGLV